MNPAGDDLDIQGAGAGEPGDGAGEGSGGGEELILGKFKSADDLAKSYTEIEKQSTKSSQRASKLTEQLRAAGYDVDDDGTIIAPGGGQQAPPQNPPSGDWTDQFNEQFYENPAKAMMEMIGGVTQMQKRASANTRRAIGQFKTDPLFPKIQDDFEAELMSIPDMQLADPQQAQSLAEQTYNQVVGRYFRKEAEKMRENPSERVQRLQSMGVEIPQGGGSPGGSDGMTNDDRHMLNQLGLSKEAQKKVIERARRSEEEG